MSGPDDFRINTYKEAAAALLAVLIKESPEASKFELVDKLRLKTVVRIKGFIKPKNYSKLCEDVVLEYLHSKVTLDSGPILPANTVRSAEPPLKKMKMEGSGSENTLALLEADPATLKTVEKYFGNHELRSRLSSCIEHLVKNREASSLKHAVLVTGDKGSGKSEVIRYCARNVAQKFAVADGVCVFRYIEISSYEILRCYNASLNNNYRVLCLLESQLLEEGNSLLLVIEDIDALFNVSKKEKETKKPPSTLMYDFKGMLESLLRKKPNLLIALTAEGRASMEHVLFKNSPISILKFNIGSISIEDRVALLEHTVAVYAANSASIEPSIDWSSKARLMSGWVCSDIISVAMAIVMEAVSSNSGTITQKHVDIGVDNGCSMYTLDGFSDIPNVKMCHVGGMPEVKRYVFDNFVDVMRNLEAYQHMGLQDCSGLLLWGPPGCGKTYLAKATANACGARFMLVNGSELLDKYVGQSEKRIRELFSKARDNSPCLIFFDEFDALCPNRDNDGIHEVSRRVVNSILTELDGVVNRTGVFVVAATNQPNLIDPAVLRSGRFEHKVFVPPPDLEGRADIISVILEQRGWSMPSTYIMEFAGLTSNYSGADLKFVLNQAASAYWRGNNKQINTISLTVNDVLPYLNGPSVGEGELSRYNSFLEEFKQ